MSRLHKTSSWIAVALLLGVVGSATAEDVTVEASREGTAVRVSAHATLRAPLDLVWRTLTDYERLPEFIPGLARSRVIEKRGAEVILEQAGEARLLFLAFPIEVTVASVARSPFVLDVHLIRGNLRRLDGGYRIEPMERGRLALHWNGLIEPWALLPPLIGELLMRANIENQFLGMVREIERRAASRPGAESGDAR